MIPSIGLDRLPILSDLHKLKYTRSVIKETLRVHHPCTLLPNRMPAEANCIVGFNARVPIKDMTLPRGGGRDGKSPVAVFKGTQICKHFDYFTRCLLTTYKFLVYFLYSIVMISVSKM